MVYPSVPALPSQARARRAPDARAWDGVIVWLVTSGARLLLVREATLRLPAGAVCGRLLQVSRESSACNLAFETSPEPFRLLCSRECSNRLSSSSQAGRHDRIDA